VSRIKSGLGLAETAGTTIQKVVTSVQQLAATVADITAANREQSAGLEQINMAVTHMDGMTQQNAALVEQVAITSHQLDEMSMRALQAVSAFRLDGAAHAARTAPVAPPNSVRGSASLAA
jgi:methyl-accepting chemotaxis protein